MVLYIEACESGSMFNNILRDDINIYAMTASNPTESSWGTYCYPQDIIQGVHMNTCLGDLFSINWLENADVANNKKETLEQQYLLVKNETDKSHVMRYGQLDFLNEVIGDFEGDLDLAEHFFDKLFSRQLFLGHKDEKPHHMHKSDLSVRQSSAVDVRDAKLHHLYAKVMTSNNHKAHLDLSQEINYRMRVDHVFEQFLAMSVTTAENKEPTFYEPTNFDCLRLLVNTFEQECGKFDDYSLKYVKYLVNECENLPFEAAVDGSVHKVQHVCSH